MLKFICQKDLKSDYVFELERAKEYYDWLGEEKMTIRKIVFPTLLVAAVPDPDKYIPVGELCFIEAYVKQFYPQAAGALKPLNVPECLFSFAGRQITNVRKPEDIEKLKFHKGMYCKHLDKVKFLGNGPAYDRTVDELINYQVSDIVIINSEWRIIVFHNEIQYVANYAGDPLIFPDRKTIKDMIAAFAPEAPVAYTLDVGVNWKQTFVIECHRFYSCGLYGFSDLLKYPKMLSQAWREILRMSGNKEDQPRFKPGQNVTVINVRSASAVGYIGTHHKICDYIKDPNQIKNTKNGRFYCCQSDNGHFTWFYEDELKG